MAPLLRLVVGRLGSLPEKWPSSLPKVLMLRRLVDVPHLLDDEAQRHR